MMIYDIYDINIYNVSMFTLNDRQTVGKKLFCLIYEDLFLKLLVKIQARNFMITL